MYLVGIEIIINSFKFMFDKISCPKLEIEKLSYYKLKMFNQQLK